MTLPICFDKNEKLVLLSCSLEGESATEDYNAIVKQNFELYKNAPLKKVKYIDELTKGFNNKEFYKAKDIKTVSPLAGLYQVAYALAFFSFLSVLIPILVIAISVIRKNLNDISQVILAIIVMVVFGGVISGICIVCGIKLFAPIFNKRENKEMVKKALITYGYITSIDEYKYVVSSKNSGARQMVRMIVNYRFINKFGKIMDDVMYGCYNCGFEPNFKLGQKAPVIFYKTKNKLIENFTIDYKIEDLVNTEETNCENNRQAERFATGKKINDFYALDDKAKELVDFLPNSVPKIQKDVKVKSEIVLGGYLIFAALFIIIGGGITAFVLSGFDLTTEISLVLVFSILMINAIPFLLIIWGIAIAIWGVSKRAKANKIIKNGEYAYAILYKKNDSAGNTFIKKYHYVFKDYKGNIKIGHTGQYFYQAKYVTFDPIYLINHKSSKNGKPKFIAPYDISDLKIPDDKIQSIVVAYTQNSSVIILSDDNKK